MTEEQKGLQYARSWLDTGMSPVTLAEQIASDLTLTRREAMLAVQEAIRQGLGKKGIDYKGYLTDDMDKFYSRLIDTELQHAPSLRQDISCVSD